MLKCLTLNTHSWMEENQLDKLEILAQRIAKEDYDLVCLQEVNQEVVSKGQGDFPTYQPVTGQPDLHTDHFAGLLVERLADLDRTYYWSWVYNHVGFDRYHEGVALLSKNPISPRELRVSDTEDPLDYHTRKVLLAETQLMDQTFTVVSLHLSWWNKGFQQEWARLEKALLEQENPIILMGDFNNSVGQEGYKAILTSPLELQDCHQVARERSGNHTVAGEIAGWQGNQEALKIDHIFCSQGMAVSSSKVVFDGQNGPVISDHYGLEVVFD